MALYGEQMRSIIEKMGIDPDTLPDKLYSTLLKTIEENAGGGGSHALIMPVVLMETITFGAYNEDLGGHTTLIETDTVLNFENETVYRVFVDGVEYEGYGWKDEWATGVEVDMGDMMLAIAQDVESGIMNADYMYNETPESTEGLPESVTLDVVIMKV